MAVEDLPPAVKELTTPVLTQAPGQPVFRGVSHDGIDIRCQSCGGVLAQNVPPDSIFDVALRCDCGELTQLPSYPRRRGLGILHRMITRDHQFVGTYLLGGEVVVGERGVRQRARESGRGFQGDNYGELGLSFIAEVLREARATFDEILKVVEPRARAQKAPEHRLARLIQLLESVKEISSNEQMTEVLNWCVQLQRTTNAFKRWADDPEAATLIGDSEDPQYFDHNRIVLEVASLFENANMGPEFVPRKEHAHTPDLRLRLSAIHEIEVETKAPEALQFPAEWPIRELHGVSPEQTIRHALRDARGQFSDSGMLVIAGDFWVGGMDVYAAAAEARLGRTLPPSTKPSTIQHYERLLGILLASLGYEIDGRSVRTRLVLRWVPNPRYRGPIKFEWRPETDGRMSIRFPPPGSDGTRIDEPDEELEQAETGRSFNPPRFRYNGDQVEVEGVIATTGGQAVERLTVLVFPPGYRPFVRTDIDLACELGFTTVTVHPDGRFEADPRVGAIDLHNMRFTRRRASGRQVLGALARRLWRRLSRPLLRRSARPE